MKMTPVQHARFWLAGLVVFALLVWALNDMLLPFLIGIAIAYFMEPLMEKLARSGWPRWLAAVFVLLLFVAGFVGLVALTFPLIRSQAIDLANAMPGYIQSAQATLTPYIEGVYEKLTPDQVEKLKQSVSEHSGAMFDWATKVFKNVWSGGLAVFDVLSLLFITPVVAFYLLRDWKGVTEKVDSWLPKKQAPTIRDLGGQINTTLSGFVRGQASVCVVLGLFYGIALTIAGLEFGFVIGMLSGILSFIPFVGSIFGLVASVGLALVQFEGYKMALIIAAIFGVGQALEGNVLTPKLVGDKVGLHSLWVIFALMAGGSLFGFVGVLLAVPVAAVAGVMVRFGLKQYLASPYYNNIKATKPGKGKAVKAKKQDNAKA